MRFLRRKLNQKLITLSIKLFFMQHYTNYKKIHVQSCTYMKTLIKVFFIESQEKHIFKTDQRYFLPEMQ